ncbi:uncharacterized protein LOC135392668 isoform X2 [Ornithodoros turicata]|uniref:uncharacterized protein LOC135392668 isoform X2 n=1 Tax=Ornithodoros turicata TaxID=34597 RepID=UPI0031391578
MYVQQKCPPGYGRRGFSCECPAGWFGDGVCQPCPPNTYTLRTGSAYCLQCPPNTFIGTQCRSTGNAVELSLLGLVMKYGFFTTLVLSLTMGCILTWFVCRKRPKGAANEKQLNASQPLLLADSKGSGDDDDADDTAVNEREEEDMGVTSSVPPPESSSEEEGGGDASPSKSLMLKRLLEQGAVLPVQGVDINEISMRAKQLRSKPSRTEQSKRSYLR